MNWLGGNFGFEIPERMRTFIVALHDFAEAQAKAVAHTKDGSVVSDRQTPESLIPYLQLPREEVAELISVNLGSEPIAGGTLLNEECTC